MALKMAERTPIVSTTVSTVFAPVAVREEETVSSVGVETDHRVTFAREILRVARAQPPGSRGPPEAVPVARSAPLASSTRRESEKESGVAPEFCTSTAALMTALEAT